MKSHGEANMNEEELKQLHGIINDLWQFIKKYGPTVSMDDAYWDEVVAAGNAIGEKHGRHPLGDQLIVACAKYLEERAKQNENG